MLESYRGMPNKEIVHAFDRQMETNILIGSPLLGKGQALQDLVLFGPTCRYYSYWQVNQVYELRNNTVLGKPNINLGKPNINSYNWLSYWVAMEIRERQRTYANVHPVEGQPDGARILSGRAFNRYQKCRQKNARKVQSAFGLGCSDYYDALRQLVDTYQDYMENERRQLAEQIRQDALRLSELIRLNYGINFDGISEELAKFSPSHAMKFRSFDIATKERDAAKRVLTGVRFIDEIRRGANKKSDEEIKKEIEVDTLLDYCEKHVSLLITALSGMQATGDQEFQEKDRAVIKYTNLKNILMSFEYLAKKIRKESESKDGSNSNEYLHSRITTLMHGEQWVRHFSGKSTDGSEENLNKLIADTALDCTAKNFLIACAGRNYVAHNFPEQFEFSDGEIPRQSDFYGDLFVEILNAARYAILYTWRKARKENCVH